MVANHVQAMLTAVMLMGPLFPQNFQGSYQMLLMMP
jgi:hypothetical protein